MSDVRVAAISDLHGDLISRDEFPPCDLVLLGGDVCPVDDHSPRAQRLWLEREFGPWLRRLPAKHVIGIPGNHDLIFARSHEPLAPRLPWHYLLDSEITLCGLRHFDRSDARDPATLVQMPADDEPRAGAPDRGKQGLRAAVLAIHVQIEHAVDRGVREQDVYPRGDVGKPL